LSRGSRFLSGGEMQAGLLQEQAENLNLGDLAEDFLSNGQLGINRVPGVAQSMFTTLWEPEEQARLEELLAEYPAERSATSAERYINIAACLPTKTSRDVALRVRWMMSNGMSTLGTAPVVSPKQGTPQLHIPAGGEGMNGSPTPRGSRRRQNEGTPKGRSNKGSNNKNKDQQQQQQPQQLHGVFAGTSSSRPGSSGNLQLLGGPGPHPTQLHMYGMHGGDAGLGGLSLHVHDHVDTAMSMDNGMLDPSALGFHLRAPRPSEGDGLLSHTDVPLGGGLLGTSEHDLSLVGAAGPLEPLEHGSLLGPPEVTASGPATSLVGATGAGAVTGGPGLGVATSSPNPMALQAFSEQMPLPPGMVPVSHNQRSAAAGVGGAGGHMPRAATSATNGGGPNNSSSAGDGSGSGAGTGAGSGTGAGGAGAGVQSASATAASVAYITSLMDANYQILAAFKSNMTSCKVGACVVWGRSHKGLHEHRQRRGCSQSRWRMQHHPLHMIIHVQAWVPSSHAGIPVCMALSMSGMAAVSSSPLTVL
jgi:hypothetical protein